MIGNKLRFRESQALPQNNDSNTLKHAQISWEDITVFSPKDEKIVQGDSIFTSGKKYANTSKSDCHLD